MAEIETDFYLMVDGDIFIWISHRKEIKKLRTTVHQWGPLENKISQIKFNQKVHDFLTSWVGQKIIERAHRSIWIAPTFIS